MINNIRIKDMTFPECSEYCELVKILGVSECDNISCCRWKFKEYKEVNKKFSVDDLYEKMKEDE